MYNIKIDTVYSEDYIIARLIIKFLVIDLCNCLLNLKCLNKLMLHLKDLKLKSM